MDVFRKMHIFVSYRISCFCRNSFMVSWVSSWLLVWRPAEAAQLLGGWLLGWSLAAVWLAGAVERIPVYRHLQWVNRVNKHPHMVIFRHGDKHTAIYVQPYTAITVKSVHIHSNIFHIQPYEQIYMQPYTAITAKTIHIHSTSANIQAHTAIYVYMG